MAENIRLAEFDIDVSDVVKSAQELKKAIDEINKSQASLRKEGETSSAQFVENEADLKLLRAEYNKHIKSLADATKATADQINRSEMLNVALSTEATTIEGLRAQNKLLNTLRNQANLTTEEGRAEMEQLNTALNRNNDLIKANVDELSQQKINVGNYTDSINEALGSMNPFNQSISVFITNVQEAGGASAFFSNSMGNLAKSIGGATKAALAFIATPIGATLAIIGAAVGLVANAMNRSEDATNKINKVFSVFSGLSNALLKSLEPLGEFLIDGIVVGFEKAAAAATKFRNIGADLLDKLGFKSAAQSIRDFDTAINEAIAGAERLAQAEANLEKAQRQARLTQLQYQKDAESLRQVRDNQNLSIRERIKANEELSAVLEAQVQEELRLAQAALEVANLRIQQEGQTKEALDAQYAALTEIADIEERINGQRSEQLTNRVSLQKEAADLALQQQKDALDLFIAEQGTRARTLQEGLELEESLSQKRKDILKSELNAKKITQDAYNAELIRMDEDLARRRAEIASDNAMREIEINRQALERQREDNLFLTQALAEQRKAENQNILLQQQELARQQLENGLINQQEFDDAIRELSEANRIANKELDDERKEIEREEAAIQRQIAFEEELARLKEEEASKFEIEQERIRQQREIQRAEADQARADGLISEELYQAKLHQINEQARRAELANEKALANNKLDISQKVLAQISGLIGKESAAGKAAAVAQATIDTYKAAVAAYAAGSAVGGPAGVVMGPLSAGLAVAAGIANVKKIVETEVPGGKGGGGSVPTDTIRGIGADLQGATRGGPANAGQIAASGNAVVQQQIQSSAEQTGLSEVVGNAVREGAREGTATGSQEGITNLSDNRAIQNSSTF